MPFHRMNESGQKLWDGVVAGVSDGSINLSLYLNKYMIIESDGQPTIGGNSPTKAKVMAVELLENITRYGENARQGRGEGVPRLKIGKKIIRDYSRYLKTYRGLAEKKFTLKTRSRLVVGLGAGGTYETGITLLRNYGVPYIPGTAIKGVAKHYAVEKLVEKYGNAVFEVLKEETESIKAKYRKEERKFNGDVFDAMEVAMLALEEGDRENGKPPGEFLRWEISVNGKRITVGELREILGTKSDEGKVVFLDALPLPQDFNDWELLEWDIMNPHYGPYYQEGKEPGDWYNPTPIKFLVVKPGVRFLFGLRRSKTCVGNRGELLGKAEALVREALRERGVGAKTSLGYGRFEEVG